MFKGYRTTDRRGLTCPKPDLTFYFPVHNTNTNFRTIPGGGRWLWSSNAQEHATENFSYRTLAGLAGHGLLYNPCANKLDQQDAAKRYLEQSDLFSFPWLVVEHKKGNVGRNHVVCQAANASMAAVMLMELAAKYAEDQENQKHVVPVPCITTVGKEVSLWITYLAEEDSKTAYVSKNILGISKIWVED